MVLHVCMHACMHVCVCTYVCMYVRRYVRTYVCMYACMYACMYDVCMMYVCVCMHACMYVCVCVPSSGFGRSPPLSIFFMRFFCFLLVPQTWRWGNLQNAGTRWVPFMLCYRQQKDLHKKGMVRLSSWGSNSNVTQTWICVQINLHIQQG